MQPEMNPEISVIICTCNRAESLKDTLAALENQHLTGGSFEIIAVDNNSQDETRAIVQRFSRSSSHSVRYSFEPQQGKSYALNRGIREARGNMLAFTDDDVIPSPDWIAGIRRAFEEYHCDCAGGPILPLWTTTPPKWLIDPESETSFWRIFALLDRGKEISRLNDANENFLYGANFAFRKTIFEELGGFSTHLGPSGKLPLRGEDTEMMARLIRAGKKIVYVPEMMVRHKVERSRMTMSYVRMRRFYGGRSEFHRLPLEKRRLVFWQILECLAQGTKALISYVVGKTQAARQRELIFWSYLGRITEGVSSRCQKNR